MGQKETEAAVRNFIEPHPEKLLGPHRKGGGYEVISLIPRARKAWVENASDGSITPMKRQGKEGVFRAELPVEGYSPDYLICFTDKSGYTEKREDPYSFPPALSDYESYLFSRGELLRAYETLGAHLSEQRGIGGVVFRVWAPDARAVSVLGNFNHWDHRAHQMTNVRDSGIWEIFIPRLNGDEMYKFSIRSSDGRRLEKADPYAFRMELRPNTASIVDPLKYKWGDDEWMEKREKSRHYSEPILIYEMHLGSWRRPENNPSGFLNYREIADRLIPYVKDLGYTHIEVMPVMEHPFDASWGYQVVSYFAPTARYGKPDDFMYFIDQCHRNGIGVILDWVPAHFPSDEYGLSDFDGTHLYDHEDPRRGLHPDWGTRIFNYGRNEVRCFLLSNAMFWLDKYHADGIRIDAVSSMLYLDYSRKDGEWLPNRYGGRENLDAIDFLKQLNTSVHRDCPGAVTVAEESTAWGGVTTPLYQGGLGFDFKWNMGWMHDTLYYFSRDPVYRRYDHGVITFAAWYAYSEKFILPFSHDEVVHMKGSMVGKMPGDQWQKTANLRLLYTYMIGSPGKKLNFMGNEFGQNSEWNEAGSLEWDLLNDDLHSRLLLLVKDLNSIYRRYPQLYEGDAIPAGFEWIDFRDTENSVISFYRIAPDSGKSAIFVFNMTPVTRGSYRIGVKKSGTYREIFNSDALEYGGSGAGNFGKVNSSGIPAHGKEDSIVITLPPLSGEIFIHEGDQ